VGSNDNFGRTPEMDAESVGAESSEYCLASVGICQGQDRSQPRLVLLTQANPSFENHLARGQKTTYLPMILALNHPHSRARRPLTITSKH